MKNFFKNVLAKFSFKKKNKDNINIEEKPVTKWENFETFCKWFRKAIKPIENIKILNVIPLDLGKTISYPFDLNRFEASKNYDLLAKFITKEIDPFPTKKTNQNFDSDAYVQYNSQNEFSKHLEWKKEKYSKNLESINFEDNKELLCRVWIDKQENPNVYYSVYETGIVVFNYLYSINEILLEENNANVFLKILFETTFNDVFNSQKIIEDFSNLSNTAKVKFIQNFVNYYFLEYSNIYKNNENKIDYSQLFFIKQRKLMLETIQKMRLALYKKDFWTKINSEDKVIKSRKKLNRPLSLFANYSKNNYDSFSFVRNIFFQPENSEIIEISKWTQPITYKGIHNYLKWNNISFLEKKLGANDIYYLDDNSSKYKCANNEGLIKTSFNTLFELLKSKQNESIKSFVNSFNAIQSFWMLSDSLINNISKVDYDFYGLKNSLPILNYYSSKLKDFNSGIQNSNVIANLRKDIYINCELEEKMAGAISAIQARFAIEDGNREKKKAINAGILQLTVLIFAGITAYTGLNRFLGPGSGLNLPFFQIWGPLIIVVVLLIAAFASYLDKKK